MFRLLSYPLGSDAPVWPGNPPAAVVRPRGIIARGDAANTSELHLFSHSGTHLDAPWHFNDQGPTVDQLALDRYVFYRPAIVDVPRPEGGFITRAEIEPYGKALADADLCLLLTGWSHLRMADPKRYAARGPVLHPAAARYLVDDCPGLKGVAIDAISIGSPSHRAETIATHHILTGLGRADGRFLLILEDLRIDPDLDLASRIYAWPLFIAGADGSPCTVVAEFGHGE